MSPLQLYLVCALIVVAIVALAAARLPAFQKDLRRSVSLGLSVLALLTVVLAVQVLSTGFRLRDAALAANLESQVAQWNGLIFAAIVLLMVSAMTVFFALGVFIWSLVPPAPTAARPTLPRNAFSAFEPPQKRLFPHPPR